MRRETVNAIGALVALVCLALNIVIYILMVNDVPYPEWLP